MLRQALEAARSSSSARPILAVPFLVSADAVSQAVCCGCGRSGSRDELLKPLVSSASSVWKPNCRACCALHAGDAMISDVNSYLSAYDQIRPASLESARPPRSRSRTAACCALRVNETHPLSMEMISTRSAYNETKPSSCRSPTQLPSSRPANDREP